MFKLKLYKFLGNFIPYFKRKIMTIDYYTSGWVFLTQRSYTHCAVPRIGDFVSLLVNDIKVKYSVIEVDFDGNDIKILLQ